MVATRGFRERGMRGSCLMDTEVQCGIKEKFWRWMVVMVAQQCEHTYCH